MSLFFAGIITAVVVAAFIVAAVVIAAFIVVIIFRFTIAGIGLVFLLSGGIIRNFGSQIYRRKIAELFYRSFFSDCFFRFGSFAA